MIKALKRKLVILTMTVVAILLFCVMAIINIFNYVSLNSEADALLQGIISYYGIGANMVPASYELSADGFTNDSSEVSPGREYDSSGDSEVSSEGDSTGEMYADTLDNEGFDINGGHESIFSFLLPDIKINDVIESMFFYVVIDVDGMPVYTDVSRVLDPASIYATNMALSLYRDHKTSGWMERCKYTSVEDSRGGRTYVFLHRDRGLANAYRVILVSLIVFGLVLLIVFVLVFLASGKIVAPFAENVEKQKSFITNASHEIKTPLAIIQANAEALELYNGKNKWTGNIQDQIQRLSILLNNMMTLARADEGSVRAESVEIDLSQALEELIVMFQEFASQNNQTIFRHIEPDLLIHGNRIQIIQLLSIILENAVKYSLEGSTIEIHAYDREKTIFLEASNRCEALPECEPNQLFERFFRPESSRYSEKPGNGIGLSAARAIIESYGGSISCSYEGANTIRFTLAFRK